MNHPLGAYLVHQNYTDYIVVPTAPNNALANDIFRHLALPIEICLCLRNFHKKATRIAAVPPGNLKPVRYPGRERIPRC